LLSSCQKDREHRPVPTLQSWNQVVKYSSRREAHHQYWPFEVLNYKSRIRQRRAPAGGLRRLGGRGIDFAPRGKTQTRVGGERRTLPPGSRADR
jgi:hypothetical protein